MSEPEVVLVVLSKGRQEGLRRCVNSAIANAGCPISVLVYFDEDYLGYRAYNAPIGVKKMLLHTRHYYVRAVNAAFSLLEETGYDIFCVTNNDVEYITPDWAVNAKHILYETYEDGMGVVELSNEGGSFYNFLSRVPFWKEFNGWPYQVFDPVYTQYFADKELLARLEAANKVCHPIPGFVISHPALDEVKMQGMELFKMDQLQYAKRHPEEVPSHTDRAIPPATERPAS